MVHQNRTNAEVFISYAHDDWPRVQEIVKLLEQAGASIWIDTKHLSGGFRWPEGLANAIENCKVVLLMSSEASVRSPWVKQEIQFAAECEKQLLPVLVSPASVPVEMRFLVAGWHWVEVLDRTTVEWLPDLLGALQRSGVRIHESVATSTYTTIEPYQLAWSFQVLRSLATFTDQIWPIAVEKHDRTQTVATRGLGTASSLVEHGFELGSRVRLMIESQRAGHLLLLDQGTEDKVYCLCPSQFATDTRLSQGVSSFPHPDAKQPWFLLTGQPGREHLLAIISNDPLELGWMSEDANLPARLVTHDDLDDLLERLRSLPHDSWVALSTYFDVTAG